MGNLSNTQHQRKRALAHDNMFSVSHGAKLINEEAALDAINAIEEVESMDNGMFELSSFETIPER